MGRDGTRDDGAGAHNRVVANLAPFEDGCPSAQPHVKTKRDICCRIFAHPCFRIRNGVHIACVHHNQLGDHAIIADLQGCTLERAQVAFPFHCRARPHDNSAAAVFSPDGSEKLTSILNLHANGFAPDDDPKTVQPAMIADD